MNGKTATEFDQSGRPLVDNLDEVASRYLLNALTLFSYLVPLALGLNYFEILSQSPLVHCKYSC